MTHINQKEVTAATFQFNYSHFITMSSVSCTI